MPVLKYEVYNKQRIAVWGDRKQHEDAIKALGGRWNARQKGGPGWLVPIEKEAELKALVDRLASSSHPSTLPQKVLSLSEEQQPKEQQKEPKDQPKEQPKDQAKECVAIEKKPVSHGNSSSSSGGSKKRDLGNALELIRSTMKHKQEQTKYHREKSAPRTASSRHVESLPDRDSTSNPIARYQQSQGDNRPKSSEKHDTSDEDCTEDSEDDEKSFYTDSGDSDEDIELSENERRMFEQIHANFNARQAAIEKSEAPNRLQSQARPSYPSSSQVPPSHTMNRAPDSNVVQRGDERSSVDEKKRYYTDKNTEKDRERGRDTVRDREDARRASDGDKRGGNVDNRQHNTNNKKSPGSAYIDAMRKFAKDPRTFSKSYQPPVIESSSEESSNSDLDDDSFASTSNGSESSCDLPKPTTPKRQVVTKEARKLDEITKKLAELDAIKDRMQRLEYENRLLRESSRHR